MKNLLLFILIFLTQVGLSQKLEVRLADVGAGLCTIVRFPNNKYMIYDAGSDHKDKGKAAKKAVSSDIPLGSEIELLVLSHMDADHIYAASYILQQYKVKRVVLTGYAQKVANREIENKEKKNTVVFDKLIASLDSEVVRDGAIVTNLHKEGKSITRPIVYTYEGVNVTLLCGFGRPPVEWHLHSASHALNAVSIVVRLEYKGKSMLLCGDAVGREIGDSAHVLIATEKFLIDSVDHALLDVDIVVAPHHGADNGSSSRFVEATSPKYVIFSSGNQYSHPTKQAVERYIIYGQLEEKNLFRTDRGEGWVTNWTNYDSGKVVEWNGQAIKNCKDQIGDDDILIEIFPSGFLRVKYVQNDPCD